MFTIKFLFKIMQFLRLALVIGILYHKTSLFLVTENPYMQ
jgi:hypothetical protein